MVQNRVQKRFIENQKSTSQRNQDNLNSTY